MDNQQDLEAQEKSLAWGDESLGGMYKNYFLDYASYVILDRAVPYYEDGFKPVQRMILHSMYEMHDGRYHKVANLIGNTMKFHPHGDASIGDALVNMGQKELLIDTQGNWGNTLTGDGAAAPRYIEARLTPFALDVLFNEETTHWIPSYDGRAHVPVTLPVKFPMVLSQGVRGIAVGLSTEILPHNLNELLDASVQYLRGEEFVLYPDFPGGGIADCADYKQGVRGARVKVRAVMEVADKGKTIIIREIPYGTTTDSLIESIVKANDKGKIKIKKVEDNTARNVEIVIQLVAGSDPHKTMAALYAFTDCEVSLAPSSCVIVDQKPVFLGVDEILRSSTDHTVQLLKWELENEERRLEARWHKVSLEKIFIENRVYSRIEKVKDRQQMLAEIKLGLDPHIAHLRLPVTEDDLAHLAEIPIRRIAAFEAEKTRELLREIDLKLEEVRKNLAHLVEYAIAWFQKLKQKYGALWPRRTKLEGFETVAASQVAVANLKYFVNRAEGFVGTSLKKDEYLFDVSELDEVICFRADSSFMVTKVSDKMFVGKDIIHVEKFDRKDSRRVFNMIYEDVKDGKSYGKRFQVGGITRDKEYEIGRPGVKCKIFYLSSNANGEAEEVEIQLKNRPRIKLNYPFHFRDLAIKGRAVLGNVISRFPLKKVIKLADGEATLGARTLYFQAGAGLVSDEERGECIGQFDKGDFLLVLRQNGTLQLLEPAGQTLVGMDARQVLKWDPEVAYTALVYDAEGMCYYWKRFHIEDVAHNKEIRILGDANSKILHFNGSENLKYLLEYTPMVGKGSKYELFDAVDVAVRTPSAKGQRFMAAKSILKVGLAYEDVLTAKISVMAAAKKLDPLPLELMH